MKQLSVIARDARFVAVAILAQTSALVLLGTGIGGASGGHIMEMVLEAVSILSGIAGVVSYEQSAGSSKGGSAPPPA